MAAGIEALMRECCNFFERGYIDATFTIEGNTITPAPDAPFVYLSGSRADGVYRQDVPGELNAEPELENETFTGRVWLLFPPRSFLTLAEEVAAYDEAAPAGAMQSESFGEYSYTRAAGTWQEAFRAKLVPFRHMFTEVR